MQNLSKILKLVSSLVLIGVISPVFAESAPVYDADALQAQGYQPAHDNYPPAAENESRLEIADKPIRLSMDQRLQKLEQQLTNLQNNDSGNKVESIQDQVQVLRNQVEEMSHALEQMQNQQRAVLADISKRMAQPEGKPVVVAASSRTLNANAYAVDNSVTNTANKIVDNPPVSATVVPSAPVANRVEVVQPPSAQQAETASNQANQPNVAEEQQIYQTAYNLIKAKQYNEAVKALQGMLDKYPSGQFASNAHYWLGELYGLMGKNDQALTEFSNVVKTYPDSPRVSDAQLKIGLLLAAEFKWSDAKSAFREVINRYPGTASSRLAAEQIKQIKQAGH